MRWLSRLSVLPGALVIFTLVSAPAAPLQARQREATPSPSSSVVIGDVIAAVGSVAPVSAPWMFRVNPARTGENPGPGPTTPAIRWSVPTGDVITSSPALDRDLVVVGSANGQVSAIESATGAVRWQFATSGEASSSPAIAGGTVFVGSNDHSLYALAATDGTERWRFETKAAIVASPAVASGAVYIAGWDGNLYALDAATGAER